MKQGDRVTVVYMASPGPHQHTAVAEVVAARGTELDLVVKASGKKDVHLSSVKIGPGDPARGPYWLAQPAPEAAPDKPAKAPKATK